MTAPQAIRRPDRDVITLRSADAHAVIAPRLGGRVLQYRSHGHDWLWVNPSLVTESFAVTVDPALGAHARTIADWFNYGGDKCWPAPQATADTAGWNGPPDPILDAGAYSVVSRSASPLGPIVLRSRLDPVTNTVIERRIRLTCDGPGLITENRVVNCGLVDALWSAWSISQVACGPGDVVDVLIEPTASDPRLLAHFAGPDLRADVAGGVARVRVRDVVGKLGFPGATGVARYVRADNGWLEQSFDVDVRGTYPDAGSRFAVWMQYPVVDPLPELAHWRPDARLIELECLAPTVVLPPGAASSLTVTWRSWAPTNAEPISDDLEVQTEH